MSAISFAGLVKQSLVDYPGEIATVLFTRGCNFLCPFCHNGHLLIRGGYSENEHLTMTQIMGFLAERRNFIDAVVISGGESTIHAWLPQAVSQIKEQGFLIKIDTNGSNPSMLNTLLENHLVDYVALDIKAPLDYKKYSQATGRLNAQEFFNIRCSVNLLLGHPEITAEFRTTVLPLLHSYEDIENIAAAIANAPLYTLQQFNPASTFDPFYRQAVPFSKEEMEELADICRSYIRQVRTVNI